MQNNFMQDVYKIQGQAEARRRTGPTHENYNGFNFLNLSLIFTFRDLFAGSSH